MMMSSRYVKDSIGSPLCTDLFLRTSQRTVNSRFMCDERELIVAIVEGSGKFADALNNNAPGDHLWEDNWDDDDIEDDFTKQLR